MKKLMHWWNGKTFVIDDGGYVPRLEERRPWPRKVYDKLPIRYIMATIGAGALAKIGSDLCSWALGLIPFL